MRMFADLLLLGAIMLDVGHRNCRMQANVWGVAEAKWFRLVWLRLRAMIREPF